MDARASRLTWGACVALTPLQALAVAASLQQLPANMWVSGGEPRPGASRRGSHLAEQRRCRRQRRVNGCRRQRVGGAVQPAG